MDVLFRELGTPGVVIMVGIAALLIYSIMKGGSGKSGDNGSNNSGGTNTPPAPPAS